MEIRVLGAGGHGLVVSEVLELQGVKVIFHDDNKSGLPPLLEAYDCPAIVAIGDNATRKKIFEKLAYPVNAIHPSAVISRSATLGWGVVVCAGVIINAYCEIGDNVILNTGCSIDHHCAVHAHAHIAPNAVLCGGVHVGEGTLVGANATVTPNKVISGWSLVKAGSVYK
jgi:sugar O-acyltransferase (sialic acid O-acetyltransferase NeuD family)